MYQLTRYRKLGGGKVLCEGSSFHGSPEVLLALHPKRSRVRVVGRSTFFHTPTHVCCLAQMDPEVLYHLGTDTPRPFRW